jgi:hypothetical protein
VEAEEVRRVAGAPELKVGTLTAFVAGPSRLHFAYTHLFSSWRFRSTLQAVSPCNHFSYQSSL